MNLNAQWMNGPIGFGVARSIRLWMGTCRYEGVFDTPEIDPAAGVGGRRVYLVWHEYMLAPIYLRSGCDIAILISQHRDADALASVARHSGYECVRGSTYRGGSTALRSLVGGGRRRNIVITPDGPRGPRRRLAAGPVFLASRLGLPIVPMGFAYDACWRMKSWDRFAVPRPFTTVRVRLGAEIRVPEGLDRRGIEAHRERAEAALNDVTDDAERWAASGEAPAGAKRLRRVHRPTVNAEPSPTPRRAAA